MTLVTACHDQASQNISYSPKLATAECRIIKHTMGETCVPVNPQRVVTLSLSTLGNVLALGVKPIGTTNEMYQEESSLISFKVKTEGIKLVGFMSWAATNMLGTDVVIDDLFKYLVKTP
ncbi:MAG TPA: hypothetical protein VE944_14525 [Nostoc sp.]|uniref:hypothetical protein n=1 Tax=Nostoc sp. TaxID=1180 RepID=UPI002D339254|nr:hypothetical protein [Nostoc sp.]HYX15553.1 hypothetical protein [Nostoc sp.]